MRTRCCEQKSRPHPTGTGRRADRPLHVGVESQNYLVHLIWLSSERKTLVLIKVREMSFDYVVEMSLREINGWDQISNFWIVLVPRKVRVIHKGVRELSECPQRNISTGTQNHERHPLCPLRCDRALQAVAFCNEWSGNSYYWRHRRFPSRSRISRRGRISCWLIARGGAPAVWLRVAAIQRF